jgi:trigger factor
MAINVETLEGLQRKITLAVSANEINQEVEARLKRLAKTVKMAGFRPGKVPMSVVAKSYGMSVQYEVTNDKVGLAFSMAAVEAQLRVAGQPQITEKEGAPEGELQFDAVFEVFPEVKIGDLASAEIEKVTTEVTEGAIDRTVDILRKQRRTFQQRPQAEGAADGDRVTVDFEGKIDGVPFDGGKAEGFQFLVGEGQMLKEFEDAVRGMQVGQSTTFPLAFPEDYHGKDVAGKTADFLVTVHKVEAAQLPEINDEFVKSLGIQEGTVDALRADVRKNLEREVKARLLNRNKSAALDALVKVCELELPKSVVASEIERLIEGARADLKQRGVKDADKAPIPQELFQAQAEQRVRMGLVVAEVVKANNLSAKPEQVTAHLEELAASYEQPADVVRWYKSDANRMAEIEAVVLENNVTDFILGQAKVTEKTMDFDELMGQA